MDEVRSEREREIRQEFTYRARSRFMQATQRIHDEYREKVSAQAAKLTAGMPPELQREFEQHVLRQLAESLDRVRAQADEEIKATYGVSELPEVE